MPKTAARRRTATVVATTRVRRASAADPTSPDPRAAPEDDPLFLPALLKVALELRKGRVPGAAFDDVVAGVVSGMGLDRDAFGHFVSQYRDELVSRARALAGGKK